MRPTVVGSVVALLVTIAACIAPLPLLAQDGNAASGTVRGRVADSTGAPVRGAVLHLRGTALGATSDADGSFRVSNVPAGNYQLFVRQLGFAIDSIPTTVRPGETTTRDVVLHTSLTRLTGIVVTESPRLAETKAAALVRQQHADNLISVLSGDEIRSLPNFNAAEAAGRIPGVSLERDEGEGKFVQVRGTEPRLSNVTINGAHVPGTERDRIAKLDDVPSDLLGAIEVSKTLTADMDADAIGGSINLVTKTPEGRPRGYLAAQYGQIDLLSRNTYQGGATYGGRFGTDGKLGFLIGGSADRNNRAINDVEPAWDVFQAPGAGEVSAPNEFSLRDYVYRRQRYGAGGGLDYRFSPSNQIYLKGLWSLFRNNGSRYVYDISGDAEPLTATAGTIPGAGLERQSQTRTPNERMWAATAGGKYGAGRVRLDYAGNFAGTRQENRNYRTSTFAYTGPEMSIAYDASDRLYPKYHYQSAGDSLNAINPANYALDNYSTSDRLTTGRDIGGGANLTIAKWLPAVAGASDLKIGVRYRDERKDFTNKQQRFADTAPSPATLQQLPGSFTDADYYQRLAGGYTLAPVPNDAVVQAYENAHPGEFRSTRNPVQDSLGSFNGAEKIYAAYAVNSTDIGAARLNLGLRVERTQASYRGHSLTQPSDAAGNPVGDEQLQSVTGTRSYTDLFPNVQLRYALGEATNLRLAFTRGIARPNYPDLAPNQSGTTCSSCANQPDVSGFSTGNPNLKAQHAWNYDLLFEHYTTTAGVLSAGVFYKSLSDVILTRRITYAGPGPFNGYVGFAPDNGGDGWLRGAEVAWVQRLVFLPGWLSGLGFDANYTHSDSRVLVDAESGRKAPLLRQSPDIANAYATYDRLPFSARIGWTYNGAMIGAYGDGSATAAGDNYFYAHSQVDGSIVYNLTSGVQLQFQALNINNAVFGFFQGKPGSSYSFQREYYGRTFFFGTKLGF